MNEPHASATRPAAGAPALHATPSNPAARWQVRLLGAVVASDGLQRIERWPSRPIAALLARLALWPERAHSREELVECLWPGVALPVGRNRLRQALSTLKSLLEPAGALHSPVIDADRHSVRVVPGALRCDAHGFERLARAGHHAAACEAYLGELMPGFYEDWIDDERQRLAALHEQAGALAGSAPAWPPNPAQAPRALPPPAAATAPPPAGTPLLPSYLTRLFGAERQGARLRSQVRAHRLVTLLGPGGAGKTRLAVDVAHALREPPLWGPAGDYAAGGTAAAFESVAFVSLVSCDSTLQALDAIAAALRLRSGATPQALALLVEALSGRRVLLVLDNFEQLVDAAAALVADLLAQLPLLHVLVTSRRRLGLDGEREFALAALELPPEGAALAEAADNPAVGLFVDRARAVRSDFHLSERHLTATLQLVRMLEGMPLAIELAASRARAFTPQEMLSLLGTTGAGLDLLARTGPRAGLDPRHASMQRVIEWSWALVGDGPRALLGALAVFRGGCTADAAAAVAGQPAPTTRLLLDELLGHSLLQAQPGADGDTRFTLYEPIREYAATFTPPGEAARWRERHRAWMQQWAATLPVTPSLVQARLELANVCAALASAVADGVPAQAVRLVVPLRRLFEDVEPPAEALALLAQAIQQIEAGLPAKAATADAAAVAAVAATGHSLIAPWLFTAGRGDEALRHAQAGVDGMPATEALPRARALHALARVLWRSTRDAGRVEPLLVQAESVVQQHPDDDLRASLFALRAFLTNRTQRDHALATALHEQALALWRASGNRHAVASGLYNLGVVDYAADRHEAALARLRPVLEQARADEDWRRTSQSLNVIGGALDELRRWPEAADAFRDCIDVAWRSLAPHDLAYGLWNMPHTLARLRQPERAWRMMAFASLFWRTRFGPLDTDSLREMERVRRLCTVQLGAARLAALQAEGEALSLAQAVALALQAPPQAPTPPPR